MAGRSRSCATTGTSSRAREAMTTPVVELLRVSTETQAGEDRAGLAGQHATNLRTCQAFGLAPIGPPVEIVESGADVARSPQMAAIMELVTSGAARGIVLAEYSRLFRPDRWSDLIILQTLSDNDARIYLPSGPIDLQSELGFVQATVNNLLAAMERKRIRERMDRGKEEHRRRGEHVAGGVGIPYGLAYSRQGGWSYTAEIERVRLLFRRYLAGERNLAALARDVSIPRTNIRVLLTNPVYTGWRVYDQRRDPTPAGLYPGGDRRRIQRPAAEAIRVRLPLESIVSPEEFQTVRALLDERARSRARESHDRFFLYRGFLRCGEPECDSPLYGGVKRQHGGTDRYYFCRSHHPREQRKGTLRCANGYLRRERVEAELDQAVVQRLSDSDLVRVAVETYRRSLDAPWREAAGDAEAIRGQAETLAAKKRRVVELFVDGVIDREERQARLEAIDRELAGLTRISGRITPAPPAPTVEAIAQVIAAFVGWDVLSWQARRGILEALRPAFYVSGYQVVGVRFPLQLLADSRGHGDGHSRTADGVTTPAGLYIPFRRSA